jgi:hypothetical protein
LIPADVDQRDRVRWLVIHLLSLVAVVPVLIWVNRDQWVSGDEWEVITTRGLGSNPQRLSIFAPHFEHWTTLVTLVYRALYSVFALHTYVPYTLVLIAVVLAVAHLLWRLLLRVGVHPAYATAVAAIFAVLAIGWENRSTPFQIAIIGPVALGIGALLLMRARGRFGWRDVGIWALLVTGLMCSGVGVTMTIVVGLAALLRRGWLVAAEVISLPAVVYAVWFVTEGTQGARNTVPLSTALRDLPSFVWRGVTGGLSGLTRIPGSGPIVLVLLVAWLVWRARPRTEPWPLVLATTVGAVASMSLTALRRAGADAEASRYVDIVVVLLLPALALATQDVARLAMRRFGNAIVVVVGAVLVGVLLVAQVVGLNHYVETEPFLGEMRPRVLATALLLREHEPVISSNIYGISFLGEPSTTTIARLDRNGDLPSLDVTRADILTIREYIQVAVNGPVLFDEGVARLVGSRHAKTAATGVPGCAQVVPDGTNPTVTVDLPSATSFRVTPGRDGELSLQLEAGQARGRPRILTATRGLETLLNVARGGMRARLGVPPRGVTTVCGLTP